MKHTPGKWRVSGVDENSIIDEETGDTIAECGFIQYRPEKTNIANAAYIVHCVNNHERLVEALKQAEVEVNKWHSLNIADEDVVNAENAWICLKKIQQALAQSKEQP